MSGNLLKLIVSFKNVSLYDGEIFVYSDICSVFPRARILQTLEYLGELLQNNSLAEICSLQIIL